MGQISVHAPRLKTQDSRRCRVALVTVLAALAAAPAAAQGTEGSTRTAQIEQAQAAKASQLKPHVPNAAEKYLDWAEDYLKHGGVTWHPYFRSPYSGGGFVMGAGYLKHVGSYNIVDTRGSFTFSGYKRIESEFIAPMLFGRRGRLSAIGGWREATEVAFYGIGSQTSPDAKTNYGFQQPYASATIELRPGPGMFAPRGPLVLLGGLEISQWKQRPGSGGTPSIETVHPTLPGVGASPAYLHTQGMIGLDWRPAPGYARRGGFYSVALHDFTDTNAAFGFNRIDYDAVQHVPILREAWVLSFHGRVESTAGKDSQQIPFFMLPSSGGGSDLRGFPSWRFRDRHSLLLQAEWRVIVGRFLDMAVFYDAGKVARDAQRDQPERSSHRLRSRLPHARALSTPLRIDFARATAAGKASGAIDAFCGIDQLSLLVDRAPHDKHRLAARTVQSSLTVACVIGARCGRRRHRAPRFYRDDPIAREPNSRDASGVAAVEHRPDRTS